MHADSNGLRAGTARLRTAKSGAPPRSPHRMSQLRIY
jgi:hypothetical protein